MSYFDTTTQRDCYNCGPKVTEDRWLCRRCERLYKFNAQGRMVVQEPGTYQHGALRGNERNDSPHPLPLEDPRSSQWEDVAANDDDFPAIEHPSQRLTVVAFPPPPDPPS